MFHLAGWQTRRRFSTGIYGGIYGGSAQMTKLSFAVHAEFILNVFAHVHGPHRLSRRPARRQAPSRPKQALRPIQPKNKNIMKIRNIICSAMVIGLIAGCASEKNERKESQAQLQAEAKVSRADAEKVALAKAPNGTIKEGELEREKGKLIWSFDIATPGTKDIIEVAVDAITGQVVSVENETPAQQEKEKKADAKEKD
jgi:hypothetical protein